jgi:hypothetical protein
MATSLPRSFYRQRCKKHIVATANFRKVKTNSKHSLKLLTVKFLLWLF